VKACAPVIMAWAARRCPLPVWAADTNNDGAISQAEFTAGALTMFDAADADRDGTLTQAERQAAREAMKAKWQARRAAAPAQSN